MRLVFRRIPHSILALLWRSEWKCKVVPIYDKDEARSFPFASEYLPCALERPPLDGVVAQMTVAFCVMDNPFVASSSCEYSSRSRCLSPEGEDASIGGASHEEEAFFPKGPLGQEGLEDAVPCVGSSSMKDTQWRSDWSVSLSLALAQSVEELHCFEVGEKRGRRKITEGLVFPLPRRLQQLAAQYVGSPSSPHWMPFLLSRMAAASAVDHPKFYGVVENKKGEGGRSSQWDGKDGILPVYRSSGMHASSSSRKEEMGKRWRWWPASRSEALVRSQGQIGLSLTHEDWVGAAVAWETTSKRFISEEKSERNISTPVRFAVDVVDVAAVYGLHRRYPNRFHLRMLPQCWLWPPSRLDDEKIPAEVRWKKWMEATARTTHYPSYSCTTNHPYSPFRFVERQEREKMKGKAPGCAPSSPSSSFIARHTSNDIKEAIGAIVLSQHWSLRECIIKLIGIPQQSFPYGCVPTADVFSTPNSTSVFPNSAFSLPFSPGVWKGNVSFAPVALPLPRGILQPFQVYQISVPLSTSCFTSLRTNENSSKRVAFPSFPSRAPYSQNEDRVASVKCMSWLEWYAVPVRGRTRFKSGVSPTLNLSPSCSCHSASCSLSTSTTTSNWVTQSHARGDSELPTFMLTGGGDPLRTKRRKPLSSQTLSAEDHWEWRPHVITVAMSSCWPSVP